jgi:hypothetical protein
MDPDIDKLSLDPQALELMNSALDKSLSTAIAEFSQIEDQFSIRQLLEKRIAQMIVLGERDECCLATEAMSWLRRSL